jgi:hypothetical protein
MTRILSVVVTDATGTREDAANPRIDKEHWRAQRHGRFLLTLQIPLSLLNRVLRDAVPRILPN